MLLRTLYARCSVSQISCIPSSLHAPLLRDVHSPRQAAGNGEIQCPERTGCRVQKQSQINFTALMTESPSLDVASVYTESRPSAAVDWWSSCNENCGMDVLDF
jgi:hypothetical protein